MDDRPQGNCWLGILMVVVIIVYLVAYIIIVLKFFP